MNILEMRKVSYSYYHNSHVIHAVREMSFSFSRGRVYAAVGKSGSGKSTMLSLLAGLDLPHKGHIIFQGEPTSRMDLDEYRRTGVGVIYQNFKLFPLMTAIENVMYPMELCGMKGLEVRKKAEELCKKVSLPETVFNRFPGMMSGGEQQRVAIARALTMDRHVILADEPTGNLDSENGNNIIKILRKVAHEEDCCVIIATHDINIIEQTDEILYIVDGQIKPAAEGHVGLVNG